MAKYYVKIIEKFGSDIPVYTGMGFYFRIFPNKETPLVEKAFELEYK